jgi:hypothetical protein
VRERDDCRSIGAKERGIARVREGFKCVRQKFFEVNSEVYLLATNGLRESRTETRE